MDSVTKVINHGDTYKKRTKDSLLCAAWILFFIVWL